MTEKYILYLCFTFLISLSACNNLAEEDLSHINAALQDYLESVKMDHSKAMRSLAKKVEREGSDEGREAYRRAKALGDSTEKILSYLDSLQNMAAPQKSVKEAEQIYQDYVKWLNRENKDIGIQFSEFLVFQESNKDRLILSSKNKPLSIHSFNLLKEQVLFHEKEVLKRLEAGDLTSEIICFEDLFKVNEHSSVIAQGEYYEAEAYIGQTVRDWRNVYIRSISVNDQQAYHEGSLTNQIQWKTKALKKGWNTWKAKVNASVYGKDTLMELQGKYLVTETK